MNILIISSSPRFNSNSDKLCDKFILGAMDAGHSCEKIRIRDKKIRFCFGCEGTPCLATNKCVQNDDMNEILKKVYNADCILFSTPCYFYTMSAQLKTFIDRLTPIYLKLENKKVCYIITADDYDEKRLQLTLESIRGLTKMLMKNTEECGCLFGTSLVNHIEENSPFFEQAYKMGRNLK